MDYKAINKAYEEARKECIQTTAEGKSFLKSRYQFYSKGGENKMDTLYEKTKGYKTAVGLVVTFVVGGLVYIKILDVETGAKIINVATYLIAFGLGDKISKRYS